MGAYSPGPKDRPIDESWPTHGWPTAGYTREKAYLERVLDTFEHEHPHTRVVRLRPGFIVKRESAPAQRRLFAGPLLPGELVRPGLIPVVPDLPGLRFQALHSTDVGQAYRLAITRDVRGAFNLAADPVIDAARLAELLGARTVPIMDVTRARTELGWSPQHSSLDAIRAFLHGLHQGVGMDTPPLARGAGGRLRRREFTTGIGQRP